MSAAILEIQATDTRIVLVLYILYGSVNSKCALGPPPPPLRIFRAGLYKYYVYLDSYDDISRKNIFNTYALKRYVWFSLIHPRTPQYVLHLHRHNLILRVFCLASRRERTAPSKKLLPSIVISSHVEEKQSLHCLKGSKEKTRFLSRWLRQKGLK